MDKKERELEELRELLSIGRAHDNTDTRMAYVIQQLGYTKSKFPIEELKKYLKKEHKQYSNCWSEFTGKEDYSPFQTVLDKIKELEDG